MTRVAVFIDYQNVYQSARDTFDWSHHHFTDGQVYPRRLGVLVTDLGRQIDASRELAYVKVFRGEPSSVRSRTGQAACHRQIEHWRSQAAVEVISRPLKYYFRGHTPAGVPKFEPREKGIDVLIALHVVMGAMRDEYDVAVLASADSDLVPALEVVLDLGKRCEVVAWQDRAAQRSRLSVPHRNIWCHWLDRRLYERVADDTDYTRPSGGAPREPRLGR